MTSRPLAGRHRAASFTGAAPRISVAPPQGWIRQAGRRQPAREGAGRRARGAEGFEPKGSRVSDAYGHRDRGYNQGKKRIKGVLSRASSGARRPNRLFLSLYGLGGPDA